MGFGDCLIFAEHLERAIKDNLKDSNTIDWNTVSVNSRRFQADFECYFAKRPSCPFRIKCRVELWPEKMLCGVTREEMDQSEFRDRQFDTSSMVELVHLLNLIMDQAQRDGSDLVANAPPGTALKWTEDGFKIGDELVKFQADIPAHMAVLPRNSPQPVSPAPAVVRESVKEEEEEEEMYDPNIFNMPNCIIN